MINDKRCLEENAIFDRQSFTRFLSSRFAPAIVVMPTMMFMGVRISWDIRERKSFLASLDCWAR